MNFEPHKANLVAPTIKMYSAGNENNGSYLWMKSSLVTSVELIWVLQQTWLILRGPFRLVSILTF